MIAILILDYLPVFWIVLFSLKIFILSRNQFVIFAEKR